METKHTSGPWEYDEEAQCISPVGNPDLSIATLDPLDHTEVDRYAYGEKTKANARLIAAAPELLAALEAAEEYVSGAYICAFPDEEKNGRVLTGIWNAIAKANGSAS